MLFVGGIPLFYMELALGQVRTSFAFPLSTVAYGTCVICDIMYHRLMHIPLIIVFSVLPSDSLRKYPVLLTYITLRSLRLKLLLLNCLQFYRKGAITSWGRIVPLFKGKPQWQNIMNLFCPKTSFWLWSITVVYYHTLVISQYATGIQGNCYIRNDVIQKLSRLEYYVMLKCVC